MNVMIPFKLFHLLYRHFVLDIHDREEEIRKQIEKKSEAMLNHYLYTKSKTADTDEEREKARQEYLESVGMLKDFRY